MTTAARCASARKVSGQRNVGNDRDHQSFMRLKQRSTRLRFFLEAPGITVFLFAIFSRWNAGPDLAFLRPFAQVICIVTPVSYDVCSLANDRFKALFCTRDTHLIACGNRDADGEAGAVADQMQLRVQPALCQSGCGPVAVFFAVRRDPVCLDVGRIRHECPEIGVIPRQRLEYSLEKPGLGSALISIAKRLGLAVFWRNIAPAVAALQTENDP